MLVEHFITFLQRVQYNQLHWNTNATLYLSYGVNIFRNSEFDVKASSFAIYTQDCYERHFLTLLKSVNHQWCIDFNALQIISA